MSNEVTRINKFETNDWCSVYLFSDFQVRATLVGSTDVITKIEAKRQLKRRLLREVGAEGVEWHLITNKLNNKDELYLKNSTRLIMWKLQNLSRFEGIFEKIEQHEDSK